MLTRIFDATGRIGEILHRRADARARAYGWQVAKSRSGLSRTYRDDRWRHARPCPRCLGDGAGPAGDDCRRCHGAGRLVDRPTAVRP